MTSSAPMLVFDGHNDVLLRLMRRGGKAPERAFLEGENAGHLDWPRMRAGGFAGGFFAIFVPSPEEPGLDVDAMMAEPRYDVPLPPAVELSEAQRVTLHMAALLLRIERESKGQVEICRSAAQIRRCLGRGRQCDASTVIPGSLQGREGDPRYVARDDDRPQPPQLRSSTPSQFSWQILRRVASS